MSTGVFMFTFADPKVRDIILDHLDKDADDALRLFGASIVVMMSNGFTEEACIDLLKQYRELAEQTFGPAPNTKTLVDAGIQEMPRG